jgi:hypothetical protein
MKVFKAEPARVLSFAPGRDCIVLTGDKARGAAVAEALRTNSADRAPIERFDVRFLETMRAKGWLRDK